MSEASLPPNPAPRRLEVSARLRQLMRYPKFAGRVPRLLILQSGYWLDTACRRAALRMGWEVALSPVVMEGSMPREMVAALLEQLTRFRPDFLLTVNLGGMDTHGVFAGLFADLEIPYVTWFVDDPRTIIMGRDWYASPYAVALTWDRAYVEYLRQSGFECVQDLPLAADIEVFNASPANSWDIPCSFVGSSMQDYAAREGAWLDERPALRAALLAAFDAGKVSRENFGQGMQTILGDALWTGLSDEEQRHLELVCFVEGTRRLRQDMVLKLHGAGLVVRGDPGWHRLCPDHGPPVHYEADLPAWYRNCAVNLNTTSIQMPTAVNQRVFDCPAAGGFLLTDAQTSMQPLFEKEEAATYTSLDECKEMLGYLLAHPVERMAITHAARRRILAHHTYLNRLESLLGLVRDRFR